MKDSSEERSDRINEVTREFFQEEIVRNNIVTQVEERPLEIIGDNPTKTTETNSEHNPLQ